MTVSARYYLLDLTLDLAAPASLVAAFDRSYGCFRKPTACAWPGPAGSAGDPIHCQYAENGTWTLTGGGVDTVLSGADPVDALFAVVQNILLPRSRSFVLLHAASLEVGGRGCLLAAPSAVGKTTLACTLHQRGWTLLSDEAGVLSRTTGEIHSFPRAIHLRPRSVDLLGRSVEAAPMAIGGEERYLIAVAAPNAVARPAAVIFLCPPRAAPPDPNLAYLELALDRCPAELPAALRAIHGVQSVDSLPERGGPLVRVGYRRQARITAAIDRVLAAADVALHGSFAGAHAPLDFAGPPRLSPVPASDGLRRVMANMLNAHSLSHAGSPASLVFELSVLLRGVRFYTLIPGSLTDSAACVASVCDPSAAP